MGRSVPSVLFSQSFRHYAPGEHVDEVRFSEPVVIAACEILELQKSPVCNCISFTGISTSVSFPVEIFVQTGGDARYKRLCEPFLYSASAPTLQDVQVSVTDHLVLRGTYDSLTLTLYGSLASNIGQVSSDYDGDSTPTGLLPDKASCRFEDLPETLHPHGTKFGTSFNPLQYLRLVHIDEGYILAIRQVLQLAAHTGLSCLDDKSLFKVVKSLVSAAASMHTLENGLPYVLSEDLCLTFAKLPLFKGLEKKKRLGLLLDTKKVLEELVAQLQVKTEYKPGPGRDPQGCKDLFKDDMVLDCILHWIQGSFQFSNVLGPNQFPVLSLIGGLAAAQLLCADAQECYRFVQAGGIDLLMDVLQHVAGDFSSLILLAVGAIECASRYAFGCEALLGWSTLETSGCEANKESRGHNKGYSILVKCLLQLQQPPVAKLARQVLHRLRAYELTAAIQLAVGIFIEAPVSTGRIVLGGDESQGRFISKVVVLMKKLLGVLGCEDVAREECSFTTWWLALEGVEEGTLLLPQPSHDTTVSTSSVHARQDIDPFLLSVLQERQLLPMVVALMSAPRLRTSDEQEMNAWTYFMGVTQALLLTLLNCRSGLLFLASNSDVATTLLAGFQMFQEEHGKYLPPLCCAIAPSIEGFSNSPQDIGGMLQSSLSVISAMDRLLSACEDSEESLWALWELLTVSRVESARQVFSMVTWFPEVMSLLLKACHMSAENPPPVLVFGEIWEHAAVHLVAEMFQVVFSDASTPTVAAWAPHVSAMHCGLLGHILPTDGSVAGSGGSYEGKDGDHSGIQEWLDSTIVYQRKGAIGLLKYISTISAGGSGLPSVDRMEIDPNVADPVAIDVTNLTGGYQGKWTSMENTATPLSDTATVQMTLALRRLALISHHPVVAAILYGEGAMTVVCSILDQCSTALNIASSAYDALLDEDIEEDGTAGDRKEHLVLGLLLPTALFLLTLLQNLQTAVQNYQNTRLLNVLLSLHHWISSRCAVHVSVPPHGWSGITHTFMAVRQVLAAVLGCWPIFGWAPSLFSRLLGVDISGTTLYPTLPPMEPIVTCSLLFLLVEAPLPYPADMLPQEMTPLCSSKSAQFNVYRSLAVDGILGVQSSSPVTWHTRSPYSDKLQQALVLHIDQIGEVISCVILQDMVRFFIIRLSCTNADHSATIVQLIMNQIRELSSGSVFECANKILQVERVLQLVTGLAFHPSSKRVLLRVGAVKVLLNAYTVSNQSSSEDPTWTRDILPKIRCWLWIVKAFTALCDPDISVMPWGLLGRPMIDDYPSFTECCSVVSCLLSLFQVVPLGKEFEVLIEGFEKLSSHGLGRAAVAYIALQRQRQASAVETKTQSEKSQDWNKNPDSSRTEKGQKCVIPIFFDLWQQISSALESGKCAGPILTRIIQHFARSALVLSASGKSSRGICALRLLFGLGVGPEVGNVTEEDMLEPVLDIVRRFQYYILKDRPNTTSYEDVSGLVLVPGTVVQEAYKTVTIMLRIIRRPEILNDGTKKYLLDFENLAATYQKHLKEPEPRLYPYMGTALSSWTKLDSDLEDDMGISNECAFPPDKEAEMYMLDSRGKFVWECSNLMQDWPVLTTGSKRKTPDSVGASRKRHAVDFLGASQGLGDGSLANLMTPSSGRPMASAVTLAAALSRRDTFRQRKPNSSRPPSMHVDDYVAREKSELITVGDSVGLIQHTTSNSGWPPSIHVDEIMTRQQKHQHLSGTAFETDEQLKSGGQTASHLLMDSSREDTSCSFLGIKVWEGEGQVISAQDTDQQQHSSSSVSESVHLVKTQQVPDILLLQSKVDVNRAAAITPGGVSATLREVAVHEIIGTAGEYLQVVNGSKVGSALGIGSKESDTPVPFCPTFGVQCKSVISHSPSAPLNIIQQPSPSQTVPIVQAAVWQASSMLSTPGITNFVTSAKGFPSLSNMETGTSQLAVEALSESPASTASAFLGRGSDTMSMVDSVFSLRNKKLLPSFAGCSARQSPDPSAVNEKIYESQPSTLLAQSSMYASIPGQSPQVKHVNFPMASKEVGLVPPTTASSSCSATTQDVVLSSHAVDHAPRIPNLHGERTATDIFPVFVPTIPHPQVQNLQSRQKSTLPVPFLNLLSAQPTPQPYSSLAGLQPSLPSGDVFAKGMPLSQLMRRPSLNYLIDSGDSYGDTGWPKQSTGSLPLPVSSLPTNSSNVCLDNMPVEALSSFPISARDNTAPFSVSSMRYLPPIPAGGSSKPQVQSLSLSIPADQQVCMYFQQEDIIELKPSQDHQLHPNFHQLPHHLLGPLPMSVHVQVPMPTSEHSPQESSAILQQMLASPEAIQTLLRDQKKLQELLEQHPKIVSLLQERMSQGPS